MSEIIDVTIEEIGAQGDGIGHIGEDTVYVPYALPGDAVKATVTKRQRGGIYAEIIEITEPSEKRINPVCKVYGACGGCSLQGMKDADYATWVKDRTIAALSHHGFDASLVRDPIISSLATRRRVALKAINTEKGVVLGFNRASSHEVIAIDACPVTHDAITAVFGPLKDALAGVLGRSMRASVNMTLTASGVDILIDAPMELTLAHRELLTDFANTHDIAALNWQDQGFLDPVVIRREAVMDFAGVKVAMPPASFVQATEEGENALVGAVVDACAGSKRVADLFSGIGTFTFPLARQFQVAAVEGAKPALDALVKAANAAPLGKGGLKQIVPAHRDLFRRPLTAKELSPFDAVVFDPPRAGAASQVAEIAASSVGVVVGVSCNPNTFSRDARTLVDAGYTLEFVQPVDQFLYSPHVELVGVFKR